MVDIAAQYGIGVIEAYVTINLGRHADVVSRQYLHRHTIDFHFQRVSNLGGKLIGLFSTGIGSPIMAVCATNRP